MLIRRATLDDLDMVAPLFDLYRQFYQCEPDINAAASYLSRRMTDNDSVVFLAQDKDAQALGFCQLYPTFCSVELIRILALYDLYVADNARNMGVGAALLQRARQHAEQTGAGRLDLQTAQDNIGAQRLYAGFGFEHSDEFQNWSYRITRKAD